MCGAAACACSASMLSHFSMTRRVSGPHFVWNFSAFSASTAAPYSMQPFSARTAGTLARKWRSISSRLPGLAVMTAITWIMVSFYAPPAMAWQTSISREDRANLPIRRYEGEVRLVESAQALADEAAAIRRESVLGFDTETRPAFRKAESYPPSLVQLAGEAVVWIFPLQRVDCSTTLKAIFEDSLFIKAGIGVADDLRQMKKLFAFEEANVVDVGALA